MVGAALWASLTTPHNSFSTHYGSKASSPPLISTSGLTLASPRRHNSPEKEIGGQAWIDAWVGGQKRHSLFTALDQDPWVIQTFGFNHSLSHVSITFHASVLVLAFLWIVQFVNGAFWRCCKQNRTLDDMLVQFFHGLEHI